ncbi:hypothetical protein GF327_04825 [Candidatus Woesearchaeota archaeon]|nr:hypothetical protein [Candidatus Woesearchaeota archaeon]
MGKKTIENMIRWVFPIAQGITDDYINEQVKLTVKEHPELASYEPELPDRFREIYQEKTGPVPYFGRFGYDTIGDLLTTCRIVDTLDKFTSIGEPILGLAVGEATEFSLPVFEGIEYLLKRPIVNHIGDVFGPEYSSELNRKELFHFSQ